MVTFSLVAFVLRATTTTLPILTFVIYQPLGCGDHKWGKVINIHSGCWRKISLAANTLIHTYCNSPLTLIECKSWSINDQTSVEGLHKDTTISQLLLELESLLHKVKREKRDRWFLPSFKYRCLFHSRNTKNITAFFLSFFR